MLKPALQLLNRKYLDMRDLQTGFPHIRRSVSE